MIPQTGNTFDIDDVEAFARSVREDARGVWYDPHAMAQTMLALVGHARFCEGAQVARLRQYDAITLEISLILSDENLTKKQIRARLDHLYNGDRS